MAKSPLKTPAALSGAQPFAVTSDDSGTVPTLVAPPPVDKPANRTQKRFILGHAKRKNVGHLQVMLSESDVRIIQRLRQAYGVDAATLVRLLMREKYAEYYGTLPEIGEDPSESEG